MHRSKKLTLSLVPEFASEDLNAVTPSKWYMLPAAHYETCTLIQMDLCGFSGIVSQLQVSSDRGISCVCVCVCVCVISGFLSQFQELGQLLFLYLSLSMSVSILISTCKRARTHTHTHTRCIQVGELVDVLNSLFSSIDFAAKCIGNVWKVETIGDCYIGAIGGPNPCEDHADRALLLAASILDIVRCMSSALTFPLRVRIGVHSGHLSAAVIGQLLPRYLVFGPDLEVANHLEALAEPQQVGFARSLSVAALCARSLMYVY